MAARKKTKAAVKAPAKKYAVFFESDIDTHDTLEAAKEEAREYVSAGNGPACVVEVLAYFKRTTGVREEAP